MEGVKTYGLSRTELFRVNPQSCTEKDFKRAADVIAGGGVVGFPTETLYGLGVDPMNPLAVEKLYFLKGREQTKPTSIVISARKLLDFFAREISEAAEILMEKFWPGPLTVIFSAKDSVNPLLTGGTKTIAARVPGSPVALSLLKACGCPLTAPSANPEGEPPAGSAGGVMKYFSGRIDLVIDAGPSPGRAPSTIVDLSSGRARIIREGVIAESTIMEALG